MTGDLKTVLAQNVRSLRTAAGISQDELAHRCGLHRTYVGGVERGERNISLNSLQKLAVALEIEPSELLVRRGPHDG